MHVFGIGCFIMWMQSVLIHDCLLTLGEAGRVVVDVSQADVYHRGAREPPPLTGHVFGLNHHLVVLSLLTVHVPRTQCCTDHTCNRTRH